MSKTKKIKIIVASILTIVAIITTLLIALSLICVKYRVDMNKPTSIIVYYNNPTQNIVFTKTDDEYNKIYSKLMQSYEEPVLKSFVNGNLNKKSKVIKSAEQQIDFKGFNIAFVYNTPQVVKHGNNDYWYKTLMFKIDNNNSFNYCSIAILPNENDIHYLGEFKYILSFKSFANFTNIYNYIENLF